MDDDVAKELDKLKNEQFKLQAGMMVAMVQTAVLRLALARVAEATAHPTLDGLSVAQWITQTMDAGLQATLLKIPDGQLRFGHIAQAKKKAGGS